MSGLVCSQQSPTESRYFSGCIYNEPRLELRPALCCLDLPDCLDRIKPCSMPRSHPNLVRSPGHLPDDDFDEEFSIPDVPDDLVPPEFPPKGPHDVMPPPTNVPGKV
jgi:hypothetical protein